MLKQIVRTAIISLTLACSTTADAGDVVLTQNAPVQTAQFLIDEAMNWICANFDLPPTPSRPLIAFASKSELTRIRIADRVDWQGHIQEETEISNDRNVVAVYDAISRTIYLPEDWTGQSAADQSILVHESVHHLQNVAGIRFECPAAREKTAYLAQDKWLARFGLSLEKEFEVDMFTVVISSACM